MRRPNNAEVSEVESYRRGEASETDESKPLTTGEEENSPPPGENGNGQELLHEEAVRLSTKITEFRLDYAISLSREYNSTRYMEGVTFQLEGGTSEQRKDKYETMRESLIRRVRNVVWRTLQNLPGGGG